MNDAYRVHGIGKIDRGLAGVLMVAVAMVWAFATPDTALAGRSPWKRAAKALAKAEALEAKADFYRAKAAAEAIDDDSEKREFLAEAREEFQDARSLARERVEARLDLAEELEEESLYRVEIDPIDFVDGIDNPFLPYVVDTTWIYEGDTEDGLEHIEVTVTDETIEILGVTCTVVRDTVTVDGEVAEDTYDYYAQDSDGNVWYFGELSFEYEDGEIAGLEGSWVAGRDGAQPGIVMHADPEVGDLYRQEFLLGEAEDWGLMEALDAEASVPFGDFVGCRQTLEGTPIEPDVAENKYYADGVGLVLEENLETGERIELIDFVAP